MDGFVQCVIQGTWGRGEPPLRKGCEKVLAALSADAVHLSQCVELAVLLFFHGECVRWVGQDPNIDPAEVEILSDYVKEIAVDEVVLFRNTAEAAQWLQQTPLHPVDFFQKCHRSPSILTTLLLPVLHHDIHASALLTHILEPAIPDQPLHALFENPYCGNSLSCDVMTSLLQVRHTGLRSILHLEKGVRYWAARLWYTLKDAEPGVGEDNATANGMKKSLYQEAYSCVDRNPLVECIGCSGPQYTTALERVLFDHDDDDVTASLCAFVALPAPTASLRHLCSLAAPPTARSTSPPARPVLPADLLSVIEGLLAFATPGLYEAFAESLDTEGLAGTVWEVLCRINLSPASLAEMGRRVASTAVRAAIDEMLGDFEEEEEEEEEEEQTEGGDVCSTGASPPAAPPPEAEGVLREEEESSQAGDTAGVDTHDGESSYTDTVQDGALPGPPAVPTSGLSLSAPQQRPAEVAAPAPCPASSSAPEEALPQAAALLDSAGTPHSLLGSGVAPRPQSAQESEWGSGFRPGCTAAVLGRVTERSCEKHRARMGCALAERRMCRTAVPAPAPGLDGTIPGEMCASQALQLQRPFAVSQRAASATLTSVARIKRGRDNQRQCLIQKEDIWARRAALSRGVADHRRHRAHLKAEAAKLALRARFDSIVQRREERTLQEIAEWQVWESRVMKSTSSRAAKRGGRIRGLSAAAAGRWRQDEEGGCDGGSVSPSARPRHSAALEKAAIDVISRGRKLTSAEMSSSAVRLHRAPKRPDFEARCATDPNYIVGDELAQKYYPRRQPAYLQDEQALVARMSRQVAPKKGVCGKWRTADDTTIKEVGDRLSMTVGDHRAAAQEREASQCARLAGLQGERRQLDSEQHALLLDRLATPLNRDLLEKNCQYYATDDGVFALPGNDAVCFKENSIAYRSKAARSHTPRGRQVVNKQAVKA